VATVDEAATAQEETVSQSSESPEAADESAEKVAEEPAQATEQTCKSLREEAQAPLPMAPCLEDLALMATSSATLPLVTCLDGPWTRCTCQFAVNMGNEVCRNLVRYAPGAILLCDGCQRSSPTNPWCACHCRSCIGLPPAGWPCSDLSVEAPDGWPPGGWPCSDLSVEASVETPAGGPSDFGTLLAPPPLRPYDGRSCTPLYRSDRPVDGTHGPWGRDPLGAPPGMWSVPLPGPRPPARTASKMIICNR